MATLRQFKSFSWTNPNFFGLIIAILLLYIIYIYFYIVLHNATALGHVIAIVAVNFFFFFTIWCFIATVIVEPGHVPQYWGLYTEEMPKNTERTYCLICHNFKPERCHHCSSCQQCVLNMDHHCPWVNNCIGYFNRKYFLLFLMYAVLALLILSVQEAWLLVMSVLNGQYAKEPVMTVIRILGLLGGVALEVSLTTFYFFHMKLVFRNTTTLEMMILERKKQNWRNGRSTQLPQTENIYDVGTYANFKQVYGRNLCYWLLPIVDDDRIQFGGIRWPFKTQSIKTETTGSPQNNGANGNNSKFSRAMTLTNREQLDRE